MKMPNPGAHVREVANEDSLLTGSHGANLNAIVEHVTSSVRSLSSEDEDHDIRDDWQSAPHYHLVSQSPIGLSLEGTME